MLLISNDSKYLFSVDESRLNVFSIQSGELVYKLSHLSLPIISICINPLNKFQLLTFHSDGKLCIWDYEDGLLLKAVETNLNVKKVICKKGNLYAIVSSDESSQQQLKNNSYRENADESLDRRYALYKLILDNSIISSTQATIGKQLILKNICLNSDKFQIDISNEENYLACLEGRKHLSIYEFGREQLNKKFNAKMDLTCLNMHPNEDCIATGTSNGKIILWYNFLACMREKNKLGEDEIEENNVEEEMNVDEEEQQEESDSSDDDDDDVERRAAVGKKKKKREQIQKVKSKKPTAVMVVKPTKSILHWHSLPVVAIKFTPEGSFLLSGGHECVLVKWLYKTGQKDFRPRLGSPITDLISSLDNTLYATRHLDNTVHLMSANLNIIQTIAPFLCPNSSSNSAVPKTTEQTGLYPTGLNYFPAMNCIVTNGKPGHLQFYAYVAEKLLFNLDVVEENYISPENLNKPLIHTQIECLSVNHNSEWLATVERRNDSVTTPDVKLKFWSFDKSSKKFTLNTIVKCPHSFERVTRIKFKSNENVLFSSGEDTCLKSWVTQKSLIKDDQAPVTWAYNSSNGYRDLTPWDFEFLRLNSEIEASKGRSVCCVAFDHILTLWLMEIDGSLIFANDLVHCDASDRIREVKSLRVAGSNFVFAAHGRSMNVWRLEEKENMRTGRLEFDGVCIWSKSNSSIIGVHPMLESELMLFAGGDSHDSAIRMLKLTLNAVGIGKDDDEKLIDVKLVELRKHRLTTPAHGPINLLLLPSSDVSAPDGHVFYCDNKGIFYQLFESESSETDLSEQMWTSREKVIRNLPDSSLAKILGETAKSAAAAVNSSVNMVDIMIDASKNPEFEANFRKIETTPAYLLPKVSSYCYNTLKSLLLKN